MTLLKMIRSSKDSSPTTPNGIIGDSSAESASTGSNCSSNTPGVTYRGINVEDEFDILKTLAEGCFAKILLGRRSSGSTEKLVLKAIHCELTSEEEFNREVTTTYYLSPHPNVVTSYNVSFMWDNCWVFVEEYAPYGDLSRYIKKGGLGENQVKLISSQLALALDFMHSCNLVHRDLKLENILVFRSNLSIIKICDFGYTRNEGTLVTKTNQTWIPFSPPEICNIVLGEKYYCSKSSDVWQAGIIIYFCLTGAAPWQVADITDPNFCSFTDWLRRKSLRLPESLKSFTPRLIRLFKRLLEPKASLRSEIREINKYLDDEWIRKGSFPSSQQPQVIKSRACSLDRKESMRTTSKNSCTNNNMFSNNCRSPSFRSTKQKSYTKVLRNYGLDTEIDKELISERVITWLMKSNQNDGIVNA